MFFVLLLKSMVQILTVPKSVGVLPVVSLARGFTSTRIPLRVYIYFPEMYGSCSFLCEYNYIFML